VKSKHIALALLIAFSFVGPARAGITLEFFQGTSQNDTTLSLLPFGPDPGTGLPTVFLPDPSSTAFVQVALHQTAPTTLLDNGNGLAAFLIQGLYGPGQPGNYTVPATVPGGGGTLPVVNVADTNSFTLVRNYRMGAGGLFPGGTEATATAFRFGGLNLNPPPSPTVDANGRIFLGTFMLQASNSLSPSLTSIILEDPIPAANGINCITDMGDNIDAVLFAGGTSYTLPIRVGPRPNRAASPSSALSPAAQLSGAGGGSRLGYATVCEFVGRVQPIAHIRPRAVSARRFSTRQ